MNLSHQKNLQPSLKDTLKERFGRTTRAWQTEHARVLQSLKRVGVGEEARRTFARFMEIQAKAAGVSAVATDIIIGAALAGAGIDLLARKKPISITVMEGLEIASTKLPKVLGVGAEAAAASAIWMGPTQESTILVARMYGSAMESMIDSVRSVRDRIQN